MRRRRGDRSPALRSAHHHAAPSFAERGRRVGHRHGRRPQHRRTAAGDPGATRRRRHHRGVAQQRGRGHQLDQRRVRRRPAELGGVVPGAQVLVGGEDGCRRRRSRRRGSGTAAPAGWRPALPPGPTRCGWPRRHRAPPDRARPAAARATSIASPQSDRATANRGPGLGPGEYLEGHLADGAVASGAAHQRVVQQEPGGVLDHLPARANEAALAVHHRRADDEVADAAVAIPAGTAQPGGDHAADGGAGVEQRRIERQVLAVLAEHALDVARPGCRPAP